MPGLSRPLDHAEIRVLVDHLVDARIALVGRRSRLRQRRAHRDAGDGDHRAQHPKNRSKGLRLHRSSPHLA
jgi:hypothetical protein